MWCSFLWNYTMCRELLYWKFNADMFIWKECVPLFYSLPRPSFLYFICTVLQCDLPTLRLHFGRDSNPGRARMLTTGPSHLMCTDVFAIWPHFQRPPGYPERTQDYGYDIASQAEREAPWTRRGSQQWGSGGVPATHSPPTSPWLEGHSSWAWKEQIRRKPSGVSTNEEGARWTGLILPQIWVGQGTGVNDHACPNPLISPKTPPLLPTPTPSALPPPQHSPMNDQRFTLPCWNGEGRGGRGWGEEITWTAAASQLTERPLGQ